MKTTINYNQKKFKVLSTGTNGDVGTDLIFTYKQYDNIITCNYSSSNIIDGHILGTVNPNNGEINFAYHHINLDGELLSGRCISIPEILPTGKIKLLEKWQWLSGKEGHGESILEEI
jgi:hypothetical protein